jgi:TorA maturation chaperone TorD
MRTTSQGRLTASEERDLDFASEILYRFLAWGFADPNYRRAEDAWDTASRDLVSEASAYLREYAEDRPNLLGFGELPAEELDPQWALELLAKDSEAAFADYPRVFGLISCRECPPYETEYLANDEPFFRAQQMADLAGFYRAFGLELSAERRDRPDHLCTQLEFASLLLSLKRRAGTQVGDEASMQRDTCQQARRALLQDHLAWWVPSFGIGLRRHAEHGFYAELGKLITAFLPIDRMRLGIEPPRMPLEPKKDELPILYDSCGS